MRRERPDTNWTRLRLLVGVLMLELIGASLALRTDLLLRDSVQESLDLVAAQLGGRLTFRELGPAGVTGVCLRDVTFTPYGSATAAIEVDEVRAYPALGDLLRGDLTIRRVDVEHLRARLDGRSLTPSQRSPRPGAGPASTSVARMLPGRVDVRRADVTLLDAQLPGGRLDVHLAGTRARAHVDEPGARVTLDAFLTVGPATAARLTATWRSGHRSRNRLQLRGRIQLDELVRLPAGLQVGRPTASGLDLRVDSQGRPVVRAQGLRLDALALPLPLGEDWVLDAASMAAAELRPRPGGAQLMIDGGRIRLAGSGAEAILPLAQGRIDVDERSRPTKITLEIGTGPDDVVALDATPNEATGGWQASARLLGAQLGRWAPLLPADAPIRLVGGTASGRLDLLENDRPGHYRVRLDLALDDATAHAPLASIHPLRHIRSAVRSDLDIDLEASTLQCRRGRLLFDGEPVEFDVDADWGDGGPTFSLRAEAREVNAERLRRGLPEGLAPGLSDLVLDGTVSGHLEVALDGSRPEDSDVDLEIDLTDLRVAELGEALPFDRLGGSFVLEVPTTDGTGRTVSPDSPEWISLDAVSDDLVWALVSAEDGRFWSHDGFDWRAIMASIEENVRAGRIVRGGSTISQQVVRSLFLGNARTLGRKLEEVVLTWQLEQHVDKRRILELYLNAVHWGPGLYGVREAAAAYFRRTPADLSLRESAFLAAILPNPEYFGIQYARGIVPPSRREKICNILLNMYNTERLGQDDYRSACGAIQSGRISTTPAPAWLLPASPPAPAVPAPPARIPDAATLASAE